MAHRTAVGEDDIYLHSLRLSIYVSLNKTLKSLTGDEDLACKKYQMLMTENRPKFADYTSKSFAATRARDSSIIGSRDIKLSELATAIEQPLPEHDRGTLSNLIAAFQDGLIGDCMLSEIDQLLQSSKKHADLVMSWDTDKDEASQRRWTHVIFQEV